jgi:threonine dehydrogenase-like Zn-dependent dehydrogenase
MEFTGFPDAFGQGLDLVRKGGRYLTVGQLGAGTTTFSPSLIVKKNIRVIGSFSGDVKSYWKALQFASAHVDRIPFGRMITGRYRLDEVNVALERMHALQEIKPLILFEEGAQP